MGAANPHAEKIARAATRLSCRCDVLTATTDMPGLMQWADMAVSAAGTTSWELCFMGVPMILLPIADNQMGIIASMTGHGIASCLAPDSTARDMADRVDALASDAPTRRRMAENGQALIDGQGATRVVNAMYCRALTLRPAAPEDCEMLLAWRNHPDVRKNSFNADVIDLATHAAWYEKTLSDPDILFYVARDGTDAPVGQIRLARQGRDAVISLNAAPGMTGRGIGTTMVELACREMRRLDFADRAVAMVKPENRASAVMFRKAGFTRKRSNENSLRFEWS
ncbi:MAG: hypothetical protein PWQ57_549 [Desulfovibrionales bacterium]|nr:hypothetical protein [Desulfovibrionales bacterium]